MPQRTQQRDTYAGTLKLDNENFPNCRFRIRNLHGNHFAADSPRKRSFAGGSVQGSFQLLKNCNHNLHNNSGHSRPSYWSRCWFHIRLRVHCDLWRNEGKFLPLSTCFPSWENTFYVNNEYFHSGSAGNVLGATLGSFVSSQTSTVYNKKSDPKLRCCYLLLCDIVSLFRF